MVTFHELKTSVLLSHLKMTVDNMFFYVELIKITVISKVIREIFIPFYIIRFCLELLFISKMLREAVN